MNKTVALFVTATLAAVSLAGADSRDFFRYYRELTPPAGQQPGYFQSLRIPAEAYMRIDSLNDMRLFAADGTELPYLRETVASWVPEYRFVAEPSRVRSFELKDNRAVIVIGSAGTEPEDLCVDRITIRTSEKDFEKRLSVTARDASGNETVLLADEPFFDQTSRLAVNRKTFALLRQVICRELILSIDNYGEEHVSPLRRVITDSNPDNRREEFSQQRRELKIDGVLLEQNRKFQQIRREETISYAMEVVSVTARPAEKTTVIVFDGKRQPVKSLQLNTPSVNWSREVLLEDPATGYRKKSRLRHLNLPGIVEPQITISLSELRRFGENCTLTIFNEDNPPLKEPQISGSGPAFRLVTLPENIPVKLSYGSNLPPGKYDIAQILNSFDASRRQYNEFQAGAEQVTAEFKPASPEVTKDRTWIFYGVLGVLVLGLFVFIIGSMRKIEKDPAED